MREPDLAEALELLGALDTLEGRYSSAVTHFRRAFDVSPSVVREINLVDAVLSDDRPADALRLLQSAIRKSPDVLEQPETAVWVRAVAAKVCIANGHREMAQAFLDEAIERTEPDDNHLLCRLAVAASIIGEVGTCAELAGRVLMNTDPDSPGAKTGLEYLFRERGESEILDLRRRLTALQKTVSDATIEYAVYHVRDGFTDEPAPSEEYQEALERVFAAWSGLRKDAMHQHPALAPDE